METQQLPLTDRDKLILSKLAQGKTHIAISQEIFIGASTVKHLLTGIQYKLHTVSNMQSVYLAAKHNII